MYPYHNVIKQRIKRGELVHYQFIDNYQGFGEVLMFYFNTFPATKFVRPHRFHEYTDLLVDWKERMANAQSITEELVGS